MDSIYKFTLIEDTGEIVKTKISQYERKCWSPKDVYYRYKGKSGVMHIYERQLDQFKNGRVYTFNPDENHAKQIIKAELLARKDTAQKELERWQAVLEKLEPEPFKPMVEIDLYSVIKQKYIEREVLDKIRTEIIDEKDFAYADFERYKEEVLGVEPDELPDDDFRFGMERAIEIIDKYRNDKGGKE